MFGRKQMSEVAHSMENLLDRMRLGKVPRDPRVLDVLFDALEKLKSLIEESDPGATEISGIVAKLNDAAEGKLGAKEAAQPEKCERQAVPAPEE